MVVECYSFSGKAQDQFRCRKIVNAQMRDRDAVADVTETLFVTLDCLVTKLSGQTRDRGLFTESLNGLREFALEAENDLGGLKQLGDHGEASSSKFNVQCSVRRSKPARCCE